MAWAAAIPAGAAGAPSPNDIPFSHIPPPSPPLPARPLRVFSPPKLLLPHKRPIPPTLCMSTPATACPQSSFPIFTPQQRMAALSLSQPRDIGSVSRTSLQSDITESFVATPSSATAAEPVPVPQRSSVFNAFATLRSWVTPGFVPLSSKPAPKRPYTKTTNHYAFPDKLVKIAFVAKTHYPPTPYGLSPVPSSLPKKMSADGGGFALWQSTKTSWSPNIRGEKEVEDVDWHFRVVKHPPFAARGRKSSRVVP